MTIIINIKSLVDSEQLQLLTQVKMEYNKTNDPLLLIEIMKLPFVESVGYN